MSGRIQRRGWPVPALLLVAATAGCATNPATGERELSLVSESQEIQMGREADPQIVASIGLYEDEALQEYVQDLGTRLAAVSERPDLPWTFRVLDDPTVNAFAVPGGFVYITRGIMTHLTSEAELVGILGHEIGHITARHSVSQISRQQLTQLGVGIGMILVPELQDFGGLANVGMQLLFLKHGRDDENQADALGVRYMTRVQYDPRELADVMAMLEESSRLQQGSGRVPEWLSTHPDPANRVEHIRELTAALEADLSTWAVRREGYLGRMDGVVFGTDPRQGYFEDDVFYHPELRFRLELPDGWRHVNSRQAVQSVSGEQDALVVLTLAEGEPRAAMEGFASQEGVRVGATSTRAVNGLPAVSADFSATTSDGTLQGRVVFVAHGGNTYRLLGYAPQGAWDGRARTVEASVASFAPENSPAVLEV
ncbi:MAG TPA: M48 family metallopeptidase, partial [Longimicrobiales bacterium]|nr:M48 family metallopeptidase [Longimicrobiales bacterium]